MNTMRIETDSLGEIKVPIDRYWGAQTERSLHNFPIGMEKMPLELIYALALVKKGAAIANGDLGSLSVEKRDLIISACDEILERKHDAEFPLSVWQTGSGTQTNMNLNEVIANLCSVKLKMPLGSKKPVHPNDDVNQSQSSNDVFPAAMHISAYLFARQKLIPALQKLHRGLEAKQKEFSHIVKVGRTHLMDAAPLTLGQEFSGYAAQLSDGIDAIERQLALLLELPLGATAVGTGLNAHPDFGKKAVFEIARITKMPFILARNRFSQLAAHDALVGFSGALKQVACAFMKIANDIRWMASGPRAGLFEISLPANEPGSSIMPGKVNPTQSEAMTMVAAQVMGNDCAICFAGSLGNFELNVFKPLIIYNILQSMRLIADVSLSFHDRCLSGIQPNLAVIEHELSRSLMLATVLNQAIGYDKASQIVKMAHAENLSLKEAAEKLGLLSPSAFDALVDPKKMI